MAMADNRHKFSRLRNAHPLFVYDELQVEQSEDGLRLTFIFRVGQEYCFRPTLFFRGKAFSAMNMTGETARSLAFHIGMVEMISYWKAFCCPQILIKPYRLNKVQLSWWHKLYLYGLGEFFFTNGIPPDTAGDFSLASAAGSPPLPGAKDTRNDPAEKEASHGKSYRDNKDLAGDDPVIVPVGGGKDSVVTLELLRQQYKILPLVVNHRGATRRVIEVAGLPGDDTISIDRTIDPLLLELNQRGFLNGHTPFSALLAFISSLAAYAHDARHIALSNESSANEPSIPGTRINHQYSKSFEFEQDFRTYLNQHIHPNINYFSFLRPLNEIQIAGLFSGMEKYHRAFRSCNAGSKNDTWCCHCPKCLFTCIILLPFMQPAKITNIFGDDLLDKPSLTGTLNQLTGFAATKPFECVGTMDEVNATLSHFIDASHDIKKRNNTANEPLPYLLAWYAGKRRERATGNTPLEEFLQAYNEDHFLTDAFNALLRRSLKGVSTILS